MGIWGVFLGISWYFLVFFCISKYFLVFYGIFLVFLGIFRNRGRSLYVRRWNSGIMAKKHNTSNSIARNKRAWYDYFIEEQFEAGMLLEGWEVKSLRAGSAQLNESYVVIRHNEVFLIAAHFSPLNTASTHVKANPIRDRKLLLNSYEIHKLKSAVERKGYTLVPLLLYWRRGKVKLEIALAKGKKQHDKRAAIRQREWDREQQRLLKRIR